MTTAVPRSVVQAFLQAFASRNPARVAPLLHDDIVWNIVGPVELIWFCGERRGKAAVLDLFERVIPSVIAVTGYDPELLLVDGDRCATLARISGHKPKTGRVISYRATQFIRFADGKVIEYLAITDTFDAAEQLLGRHIDLEVEPGGPDAAMLRNYFAV